MEVFVSAAPFLLPSFVSAALMCPPGARALTRQCCPRSLPRAAAMLFVPMYTVAAVHRGLPKMPILYGLGVLCAVVR